MLPLKARVLWIRFKSAQYGWRGLAGSFAVGALLALTVSRGIAIYGHSRGNTRHSARLTDSTVPRLEFTLHLLRGWPQRAPDQVQSGALEVKDFPLAQGLLSQYLNRYPGKPWLASQLAILEAAEGSDRDRQVYQTVWFSNMSARPVTYASDLVQAMNSPPPSGRRDFGFIMRLMLALPGQVGPNAVKFKALYRDVFTRPVQADADGSEAVLLAFYGYLRLENDWSAQKLVIRDALAAQGGDPRMQDALRRVTMIHTQEQIH